MDIGLAARFFALDNALSHKGKAQTGAVIGRLMSEFPEMRERSREVSALAVKTCADVNAMAPDAQLAEHERLSPEMPKKEKAARRTELPDLPGVEGGVVMRLAPNPSGLLHLGHTRMAILNDEYVKRYGGKLIVRMEDTNPAAIHPEAYEAIPKDLDWLGIHYDEVCFQSDRFDLYYEAAERLLEKKCAYLCTCDQEVWRTLKLKEEPCPHRGLPAKDSLAMWKRMLDGSLQEGTAIMVVKTDLSHKNPAVRDFVAFRMLDAAHPRTGTKYRVYPTYNFAVAVDDHLMGMTHVLRGKDHLNNTIRQEYVFDHMGWKKPVFIHYGWVSIEEAVLKKSLIKESVKDGTYSGWDDVRLGTIQALAKRGIHPGAIRQYWIDVGIKEVDITFSWDNLYAYSRELLDPTSLRYFFVADPQQLQITGAPLLEAKIPRHPDRPELGTRTLHSCEDGLVYISGDDLPLMQVGAVIRLKDLGNVKVTAPGKADYVGNDRAVLKTGAKIVHWLGAEHEDFRVQMPDGLWREGFVEPEALDRQGEVVQFERFGFTRIDGREGFYAHR